MNRFAARLAPLLVLAAVLAVCFHRLIESPTSLIVDGRRPNVDHASRGRVREVGNDLTWVFLPRFVYVVGQIRTTGKAPSWDALGFGGRPLVGNPQAGCNYPPVWLAWGVGHPGILGWLTVAHLAWAGLGVYTLGRVIGLRRSAAVIAGACFEASPYLIAHTAEGHYPHVWAACWYPWAFWALGHCLKRNPLGYWSLPPVLALTFLTGHPQEWYYLVVALTGWVALGAFRAWRERGPRSAAAPVLTWLAILAISLAFCAAEWMPQVSAGPWSLKSGTIHLSKINRFRVHSTNLLQLLSPLALGGPADYRGEDNYWETVLSIGLVPLVLAGVGAAAHPDRAARRGWFALVIGAALFAAGKQLGLYSLFYAALPGMERFRIPARSLFLASLGASVLAGAGVDRLLNRGLSDRAWNRLRWSLRLSAGALIIAVLVEVWVGPQSAGPESGTGNVEQAPGTIGGDAAGRVPGNDLTLACASVARSPAFWLSALGLCVVPATAGRSRRGQALAAWGLGGVGVAELAVYAQSLLVCAPVSEFLGHDPVGRAIRDAEGDGAPPVRLASFGTVYPDLRAAAIGLEKTNINDGFQIQHAADLYEQTYPLLDPCRPRERGRGAMDDVADQHRGRVAQAVLDLMGVRYVVTDRPLPLPSFEPVGAGKERDGKPGGGLWKNQTALPRAYVVPRAIVARGGRAAGRPRLLDLAPREGVVLERDPLPKPSGKRQSFTPAQWLARDADEVVVRVRTEAPGLLVVGTTWMPGWTATVDSRPAPVLRGNHWQQVVPIADAGRHEIVLRYEPPGFDLGSALTAVAATAWGGIGLALLARRLRVPRWEWDAKPSASPIYTS